MRFETSSKTLSPPKYGSDRKKINRAIYRRRREARRYTYSFIVLWTRRRRSLCPHVRNDHRRMLRFAGSTSRPSFVFFTEFDLCGIPGFKSQSPLIATFYPLCVDDIIVIRIYYSSYVASNLNDIFYGYYFSSRPNSFLLQSDRCRLLPVKFVVL
jgi:hypothetical protein